MERKGPSGNGDKDGGRIPPNNNNPFPNRLDFFNGCRPDEFQAFMLFFNQVTNNQALDEVPLPDTPLMNIGRPLVDMA